MWYAVARKKLYAFEAFMIIEMYINPLLLEEADNSLEEVCWMLYNIGPPQVVKNTLWIS